MDREQAAEALAVLRNVVAQTRDDTALQNWGVIWMVQGVANGAGFIATHLLFAAGYEDPPTFLMLWVPVIALNIVVALGLKKQRAGARTFVENQLWSIWTTFIAAVCLTAVLNHVMGLKAFFLGPVIGVLAAAAFASMGSLMGTRWLGGTAVFCVTAIAMAVWHESQFIILGVVWGVAQAGGGALMHRARRRRLAGGESGVQVV